MNTLCCIVGAGSFSAALLPPQRDSYFLIAADGGYAALKSAGLRPDLCVGDFDSLGFVPDDCETVSLPVEKDETDMGAAALLAARRGFRTLYFYGVLGGSRFSHSLAAVQTLVRLRKRGLTVRILDQHCILFPVAEETVSFPDRMEGDFSLFAISDQVTVSFTGLKYPLHHQTLTNTFPLGVSNSFTGGSASVTVTDGAAVAVLEGKAIPLFLKAGSI